MCKLVTSKLYCEINCAKLLGGARASEWVSEWVLYLVPTEAHRIQRITQAKEIKRLRVRLDLADTSRKGCALPGIHREGKRGSGSLWCNWDSRTIPTGRALPLVLRMTWAMYGWLLWAGKSGKSSSKEAPSKGWFCVGGSLSTFPCRNNHWIVECFRRAGERERRRMVWRGYNGR